MENIVRSKFGRLLAAASLAGAGVVAAATIASATVTFDPSTGTGYIGRGDVISNATLGKEALTTTPDVSVSERILVTQTCQKATRRHVVSVEMKRNRNVTLQVQVQTKTARGNGNISGYVLGGFSAAVPAIGTVCPADFVPVASPTIEVLGQSLTFSGNGLTGTVWSQ